MPFRSLCSINLEALDKDDEGGLGAIAEVANPFNESHGNEQDEA